MGFDSFFLFQSTDSFNKNLQAEAEINEREPTENEDVMIKIIRVIANLSINEQIGNELAKREDCLNILLKILGFFSKYFLVFFINDFFFYLRYEIFD